MKKLIFVLALMSAPAVAEKLVSTKVKIDGTSYYVRYKPIEKTAVAIRLGFNAASTVKWMRAKTAIRQVTGCEIVDSFERDATLYASLDCPKTDTAQLPPHDGA